MYHPSGRNHHDGPAEQSPLFRWEKRASTTTLSLPRLRTRRSSYSLAHGRTSVWWCLFFYTKKGCVDVFPLSSDPYPLLTTWMTSPPCLCAPLVAFILICPVTALGAWIYVTQLGGEQLRHMPRNPPHLSFESASSSLPATCHHLHSAKSPALLSEGTHVSPVKVVSYPRSKSVLLPISTARPLDFSPDAG